MNIKDFFRAFYDILKNVVIIFLIAFAIRYFVMQPFIVDGSSMEPNYHNKEYLIVNKIAYRFSEPKKGDVVVFKYPKDPAVDYIKRIIATPGDVIDIKDNLVRVNGQVIDEPYLSFETETLVKNESGELARKLKDNEYFVLGDNRTHSSDSREWGILPKENIVGKSSLIVFPIANAGLTK